MPTYEYQISEGPSREDIIRSWQSMGDKHRFTVKFALSLKEVKDDSGQTVQTQHRVRRRHELSMSILGMLHDGGNGHELLLRANIHGVAGSTEFFYYSDRRSGSIKLPIQL